MLTIVSIQTWIRQDRSPTGPAAIVAGLTLFAALAVNAADGDEIEIEFSGTAGLSFVAKCVVTAQSGDESRTFTGAVPARYSVTGEGIACRITRPAGEGHVFVEIAKAGRSVSRASVGPSPGVTTLSVR